MRKIRTRKKKTFIKSVVLIRNARLNTGFTEFSPNSRCKGGRNGRPLCTESTSGCGNQESEVAAPQASAGSSQEKYVRATLSLYLTPSGLS